jgi:hypothetical protein
MIRRAYWATGFTLVELLVVLAIVIVMHRNTDLLEIIHALGPSGGGTYRLHCRDQEADQDDQDSYGFLPRIRFCRDPSW